jgi:hypothetical protein
VVVVAVHQGIFLGRVEKAQGLVPGPVLDSQKIQGGMEGVVFSVKGVDLLEGKAVNVEGDMERLFVMHIFSCNDRSA